MKAIRTVVDFTMIPNTVAVLEKYKDEIEFLRPAGLMDAEYRLTDDGCLFGEEIAYMLYPSKVRSPATPPKP